MRTRKFITALVAIPLALSMAACSNSEEPERQEESSTPVEGTLEVEPEVQPEVEEKFPLSTPEMIQQVWETLPEEETCTQYYADKDAVTSAVAEATSEKFSLEITSDEARAFLANICQPYE